MLHTSESVEKGLELANGCDRGDGIDKLREGGREGEGEREGEVIIR